MNLGMLYKTLIDYFVNDRTINYGDYIDWDIYYLGNNNNRYDGRKLDISGWQLTYYNSYDPKKPILHDCKHVFFVIEYDSHGESGGNCWGGDARAYARSAPINFNFDDQLVEICEKFCPEISYLNFRKVTNGAIFETERHVREYYGNNSVYKVLALDIRKLAENLHPHIGS